MTAYVQESIAEESTKPSQVTDSSSQVSFWKKRIESAKNLSVFKDFKEDREEAKKFYRGEIITDNERQAWEGDEVKVNLFRKNLVFKLDAVYYEDPKLKIIPRAKINNNPQAHLWSDSVTTHLNYLWDEESIGDVIRTTFVDAHFGNYAVAIIDFDDDRGLWRAKWLPNDFLFDPDSYGDLKRARWIAFSVKLPRYRVWQDERFDAKARAVIKERSSGSPEYVDTKISGEDNNRTDQETLWYIYTKEGVEPYKGKETIRQRLLVLCENYNDNWLMNIENPSPPLDQDEFPIELLQFDSIPGDLITPGPWNIEKSTVRAFNWGWSYNLSKMRKSAMLPIGFDKNRVDDPDKVFHSRRMMQPISVDGNPGEVIAPLDLGQGDDSMLRTCEALYQLNDQVTGITEISRGEKSQTQTATESQIRQQQSNIVLRGPSRALDKFAKSLLRKLALYSLYYIPAFSIVRNPQYNPVIPMMPQFLTKQPQQVPVMDPSGMIVQQTQLAIVPIQATEEIKGIDYFHGDQVALNWPQIPFEEIKCDLAFSVEAGSSSATHRLEKRRDAEALMATLGAEYESAGMYEEKYALLEYYIDSFDLPDRTRFLPAKEIYIQKRMMMQQIMMQQQSEESNSGGESKANPGRFNQSKNEGKRFPLGSDING